MNLERLRFHNATGCRLFVGCAGWNLRKELADAFPLVGSHLERYAVRLNCVEINSSFYHSHRKSTYLRWAESTPDDFRFSVKVPKQITHVHRLVNVDRETQQFVDETSALGNKLGPMLLQLPPSLEFDVSIAEHFFRTLRQSVRSPIVCEPRHLSWFTRDAENMMQEYVISRVAADPAIAPAATFPGACLQACYFRWHGTPRMYYSAYDEPALINLAKMSATMASEATEVWCIFDNTALGAAWRNAIELIDMFPSAADLEFRPCR
jgi:uncharacterized protein YecE (DUF72 family)